MAAVDNESAKLPPQPVVAQLGLPLAGGEPIVPVPGQRRFPVSDESGRTDLLNGLNSHGFCCCVMVAALFVCGLPILYGGTSPVGFSVGFHFIVKIGLTLKLVVPFSPPSRVVLYFYSQIADGQRKLINQLEKQIENVRNPDIV